MLKIDEAEVLLAWPFFFHYLPTDQVFQITAFLSGTLSQGL